MIFVINIYLSKNIMHDNLDKVMLESSKIRGGIARERGGITRERGGIARASFSNPSKLWNYHTWYFSHEIIIHDDLMGSMVHVTIVGYPAVCIDQVCGSFHWFSPSFGWCATLSLGCSPVRLWWLELIWLRWALDYLALLLTPLSWCRS